MHLLFRACAEVGERLILEQPQTHNVLILGIGNPLCGDDGAGARAADLLADRCLPDGVHVQFAGTPGWGLSAWMEGWPSVILVDAVEMGASPGEWRRFQLKGTQLVDGQNRRCRECFRS